MADLTGLTNDELAALVQDVTVETQRRQRDKQMLDAAHRLIMDARNAGFTRQQVIDALLKVVNTYYPPTGA